jgi:hypothetical protein
MDDCPVRNVGFAEVIKRNKTAAGTLYTDFHTLWFSALTQWPADRSLAKHRASVRDVLIDLFEMPIPETAPVNREIVSRILGKPADWAIFSVRCIYNDMHCQSFDWLYNIVYTSIYHVIFVYAWLYPHISVYTMLYYRYPCLHLRSLFIFVYTMLYQYIMWSSMFI